MNLFKLSPVILSALLLAAHFFRMELYGLVITCLLFPLLLFLQNKWSARAIQVFLIIGALEWFRTLYNLVVDRIKADDEWTRLALILGGVILFTGLSTLVFKFRSIRRIYNLDKEKEEPINNI